MQKLLTSTPAPKLRCKLGPSTVRTTTKLVLQTPKSHHSNFQLLTNCCAVSSKQIPILNVYIFLGMLFQIQSSFSSKYQLYTVEIIFRYRWEDTLQQEVQVYKFQSSQDIFGQVAIFTILSTNDLHLKLLWQLFQGHLTRLLSDIAMGCSCGILFRSVC